MSKLDAQRAMREANYASRRAAPQGTTASTRRAPVTSPRDAKPQRAAPGNTASVAVPDDDACGRRSMNGRTCTRPAGHAEKNHRYG